MTVTTQNFYLIFFLSFYNDQQRHPQLPNPIDTIIRKVQYFTYYLLIYINKK